MTDRYASHSPSLTSPVTSMISVTPSDTVEIDSTKSLLIIGSGNLTVLFADDTVAQTIPISGDCELFWRVKKVLATGTTVTAVKAAY